MSLDSDSIMIDPEMQCPDIRVILAHFLRQIESRHARTPTQGPTLLHWNSVTQSLEEFFWPLDGETGNRIPPSEWEAFRRTHKFRAPSCLCAYLDDKKYTESRVGIVEITTSDSERNKFILNGEYVAACAEQRCGFLLCIERLYTINGLKVKFYPKRAQALPPVQLAHVSEIDMSFRNGRHVGLSQVMTNAIVKGMGRRYLPTMTPREAIKPKKALMWELSRGIPEARFWETFVQCLACKDVVFRDTMAANHNCRDSPSKDNNRRHHPYSRAYKLTSTLQPVLTMVPADVPEASLARCPLRARSPVPTEIDSEAEGPAQDGSETEPEDEVVRESSPLPSLSSDFEMPSVLELMDAQA